MHAEGGHTRDKPTSGTILLAQNEQKVLLIPVAIVMLTAPASVMSKIATLSCIADPKGPHAGSAPLAPAPLGFPVLANCRDSRGHIWGYVRDVLALASAPGSSTEPIASRAQPLQAPKVQHRGGRPWEFH